MNIDGKKLQEYSAGGVAPITVAMRVNAGKDACDGLVLGFDWNKAYQLCGVKAEEMAPAAAPAIPCSG